jgi:hypothetical protein
MFESPLAAWFDIKLAYAGLFTDRKETRRDTSRVCALFRLNLFDAMLGRVTARTYYRIAAL